MSRAEHDDDCPGCRPVMIDLQTGKVLPDHAPPMKHLLAVWSGTSMAERQAFHRVTCLNSRDFTDLVQVDKIRKRFETP